LLARFRQGARECADHKLSRLYEFGEGHLRWERMPSRQYENWKGIRKNQGFGEGISRENQ